MPTWVCLSGWVAHSGSVQTLPGLEIETWATLFVLLGRDGYRCATAGVAACGLWFGAANEGTQELAVHLLCDGIHVNAGLGEELAGVCHVVGAGCLHVDVGKTGRH